MNTVYFLPHLDPGRRGSRRSTPGILGIEPPVDRTWIPPLSRGTTRPRVFSVRQNGGGCLNMVVPGGVSTPPPPRKGSPVQRPPSFRSSVWSRLHPRTRTSAPVGPGCSGLGDDESRAERVGRSGPPGGRRARETARVRAFAPKGIQDGWDERLVRGGPEGLSSAAAPNDSFSSTCAPRVCSPGPLRVY